MAPELREALVAGLEMLPEQRIGSAAAFAEAIGAPLTGQKGASLAASLGRVPARSRVMEAIVRTAAGVFEAAAASIALVDPISNELVYEAAWGAGASEVVGMRLPPGAGLAGAVVTSGEGVAVPQCRQDPRFAAQVAARTGYVPYTMVVTPLVRDGRTIGVMSMLDKRDGGPYLHDDLVRAALFADLAVVALDLDVMPLSTTGGRLLA
jgi:GAF domain-containing protein